MVEILGDPQRHGSVTIQTVEILGHFQIVQLE